MNGSEQKPRKGIWSWLVVGAAFGPAMYAMLSRFFPRVFPSKAPRETQGEQTPPAAAGQPPREIPPLEEPRRATDRNMEKERKPGHPGRKLGTILAAFTFFCGVAGGIGFMFIFWTGGSNTLLGGTLGISFAGFGCAFVLWAHLLMRHKEAVEEREESKSSPEEEADALREFNVAEHEIQRRTMLKAMIGAIAAVFAAMFVSVFRSLGKPPLLTLLRPIWKRGDQLVKGDGGVVTIYTLEYGSTVTVYPANQIGVVDAQTVLVRVPPEFLNLPKNRAGWAPMGYIAYSRVCTHAGCPVGEFESQRNLLLCPCHQSTFAVLDGAQPTGGPATRPLPQLPLFVDAQGNLRAAGDFSQPPGPGYWDIPE